MRQVCGARMMLEGTECELVLEVHRRHGLRVLVGGVSIVQQTHCNYLSRLAAVSDFVKELVQELLLLSLYESWFLLLFLLSLLRVLSLALVFLGVGYGHLAQARHPRRTLSGASPRDGYGS